MKRAQPGARIGRQAVTGTYLLLLVAAVGCGGRKESELDAPVYAWNHESGFCGSTLAVDGERGLWAEGGCENGGGTLSFQRTLSADQLARIQAAFQTHPDPATFEDPNCQTAANGGPSSGSARFTERRTDGTVREWRLCTDDLGSGSAYPAPFDATARAFQD